MRFRVASTLVAVVAVMLPLGASTLVVGKPEDAGFSSERLARVREAVKRHLDAGSPSGAVTLVARRGKIVHFEAHGLMDVESRKPMPKDGIFRLASTSKPITAAAVLMMVEEGKVRLTDPVSRFIPEFKSMKVAVPNAGRLAAGGGRGAEFDTVSGVARDHGPRSADARLRADERRARQRRAPAARRRTTRWRPSFPSWRPCRWTSSPARCGATAARPASMC